MGARAKSRFLRAQRVQSVFHDSYSLIPLTFWLPELRISNPGRYKQVVRLTAGRQTGMSSRNRKPHGKTVRLPDGYDAFVPAPLPPAIEWNRELVNALSAADRAIGRLAGESRRLPNPHLLLQPFIRREAVLSSRVEGTESTLTELLAAEAGARVARDSADLQEVANYVRALDYSRWERRMRVQRAYPAADRCRPSSARRSGRRRPSAPIMGAWTST